MAMSCTASSESKSPKVSDNQAFWRLAKPFYRIAKAASLKMDSASTSTESARRSTALGLLTSQLIRYYGSDLFSLMVIQPDLEKLVMKMQLSARMSLETWQLHVAQNKLNLYNPEVRRVMNSTLASALQTWKQHSAEPEAARRRNMRDVGTKALVRCLRKRVAKTFVVWQGLKNQVKGSRLYDRLQDRHGARKSSQHAPAISRKNGFSLATLAGVSGGAEEIRGVFARINKSHNAYQPASESGIEGLPSSSNTINCPAGANLPTLARTTSGAPLPRTTSTPHTSLGSAISRVQLLNRRSRRISQGHEVAKNSLTRSLRTDPATIRSPGKSLRGKMQLLLDQIHTAIDLEKLENTSKKALDGGVGRLKQAVKAVIIANRLIGITDLKCPVTTVEISAPSTLSRAASLSTDALEVYKISSHGSALLPDVTSCHASFPKQKHLSTSQPRDILHSSASSCKRRLYSHFFDNGILDDASEGSVRRAVSASGLPRCRKTVKFIGLHKVT
eukprot:CAMPEP_0173074204 /NCGR_PEP_ID=MMETSP1102-20130122/10867_1 /TAXON_ID=49646 /ORGANISM="Geminigera sp., Strain Caron Lab Isolate" /LENGTH=502 /DNA_ID=CAMNT_0013943207 /DNA_START=222 /DNA_END=1730 /DNA_ORIENTATION=-